MAEFSILQGAVNLATVLAVAVPPLVMPVQAIRGCGPEVAWLVCFAVVPGAAEAPEAAGETFNVGATDFGTVRSDLQALIDHAGSSSHLRPVPVKPAELALRALELARLSPLAEWHYKTAHKDSYVDVSKAQRLLGWQPRLSNSATLIETYDWYLANRERVGRAGVTHRVPWNQQALGLLKRLS